MKTLWNKIICYSKAYPFQYYLFLSTGANLRFLIADKLYTLMLMAELHMVLVKN